MHQEGAVILGTGGDNSNESDGSFFEGVITAGYPSDATDNAVQANIVAVGYKQVSTGFPATGSPYTITNVNSGTDVAPAGCGTTELSCEAQNVVYERGHASNCPRSGTPSAWSCPPTPRSSPACGLPRLKGELGAHPGMCVDRVEHPKGDGSDRIPRLRPADHLSHDPGDYIVGGRREQFVFVGDVPVDRPGPCCQARR